MGSSARKVVLRAAYKIGGKQLRDKVIHDLAEIKISFVVKG
jgi:hypothetical protein